MGDRNITVEIALGRVFVPTKDALCRDCQGSGICEHGKQRRFCRPSRGIMFCKHEKRKDYCKICLNISNPDKTDPLIIILLSILITRRETKIFIF